jgi:hypothetical protein
MNAELLEVDLLIPDETNVLLHQNQIIEKELILEEIMLDMGKENDFSVTTLIRVILVLLVTVLLFGVKIHFSNQIYELSRDISRLKEEKGYLEEQKTVIELQLEKARFKNDITDRIF